jgi:hypothetical protein
MLTLFLLLLLLNGLDILTTILSLRLGAYESNPAANKLIDYFGFKGAVVLKIVVTLVLGLVYLSGQITEKLAYAILIIAIAYYLIVLINNLFWIKALLHRRIS